MNVVVPDASVILKWALPSCDEPDADRALLLRNAIRDDLVRAVVPSLWLYEVGNTVARRFPTHADARLSALVKFGLEESPVTTRWLAAPAVHGQQRTAGANVHSSWNSQVLSRPRESEPRA